MDIHLSVKLLTNNTADNLIWGMPSYVCWIIIAVLLVVTGMFSASENAFTNCNKYHFRAEAEKGKHYAKIITHLVDKFDNTLVTVLVSLNTSATIMSYLSAMLWYQICVQNHLGDGLEVLFSTVVMGFLFYVISDTIPKVVSRAIPDQMAIAMCYPIRFLEILLFPLIFVFRVMLKAIHRLFHLKDENLLSKEDLLNSASKAVSDDDDDSEEKEKLFEKDETTLMNNVLVFDTRTVKQVYTPIEKMFALDINGLTVDILNQEIQKTEYSRIPVYDENKENIIGILVVRIYFEEYLKDAHLSIPSILEDVVDIDVNEKLDDAFQDLNSQKVHLGVVKEEGKVIGIVSMDDILEELVEDIDEDNAAPRKEYYHE